jgi:hypothetical protein
MAINLVFIFPRNEPFVGYYVVMLTAKEIK